MSLPLNGVLTPEKPISPSFEFIGEVCILIEGGFGTVELQRSLKGSDYKALTDTSGNPVIYSVQDNVGLNAEISNKSSSASYRLVATSVDAPINYVICK